VSLGVGLRAEHPPALRGVAAIETIERLLLHDKSMMDQALIRLLPVAELLRRSNAVAAAIVRVLPTFASEAQAFVSFLYAWHGCLNMAKACRRTYRTQYGEVEYSLVDRQASYAALSRDSLAEEARGNTWVRYGVTLARPFERGRGLGTFAQRVADWWVPRDSPYWEAAV
jgi:hypothetical protein